MGDKEFKCWECGKEASVTDQAAANFELPKNWGFVRDEDPYQPDGRGAYYACEKCKEDR